MRPPEEWDNTVPEERDENDPFATLSEEENNDGN
jgi:hypothetical protein